MTEPFLRAVGELKLADELVTAFFRVSEHVPKSARLQEFLAPYFAAGVPVTLQLMGTDAAKLAETAHLGEMLGVSGIDFNFGCPSRKVLAGGAGGAMLRTPDRCVRILEAARAHTTLPVSAKIRTGFACADEMEQIIPKLIGSGCISRIAIHFRTVKEGYLALDPAIRPHRLRRACELAAPCPVLVNGDITTEADGRSLVNETKAAGAMSARGFLRDPYLPRRLTDQPSPEPAAGRIAFYRAALADGRWHFGNAVELAKWGFGTKSPLFCALISAGELQPERLCAILNDMAN